MLKGEDVLLAVEFVCGLLIICPRKLAQTRQLVIGRVWASSDEHIWVLLKVFRAANLLSPSKGILTSGFLNFLRRCA